ncbi:MAG: hypothetical protein ACETVR_03955, partial [Candidatus Bathyarchaeia archaeon]
ESCLPEPPVFVDEDLEELDQGEREAIALEKVAISDDSEDADPQLKSYDFFDDVLFTYLKEHGGSINIVECSNDLNLSYDEIRRRLNRLKNLGKIKIEG